MEWTGAEYMAGHMMVVLSENNMAGGLPENARWRSGTNLSVTGFTFIYVRAYTHAADFTLRWRLINAYTRL